MTGMMLAGEARIADSPEEQDDSGMGGGGIGGMGMGM